MNTKGGQLIGELKNYNIIRRPQTFEELLSNVKKVGRFFSKLYGLLKNWNVSIHVTFLPPPWFVVNYKNCQLPSNIIRACMVKEFWLDKNLFTSIHIDFLSKEMRIR